jgi:hypothetical protein
MEHIWMTIAERIEARRPKAGPRGPYRKRVLA